MLQGKQEIGEWFHQRVEPSMSDGDAVEAFHRQHPSKVFLRNLPLNSTVVDVGSGEGGLSIFKSWPSPARADLKLFGFSLEKGRLFDNFEGYELGNWNEAKPSFGGKQFDAIHCANFIEHIDEPGSLVKWASERLRPGGRLYIEWPTAHSLHCPTLPELADIGFDCIIGNYFDDPTHRKHVPTLGSVTRGLKRAGFSLEASGTITMPLIADELLGNYQRTGDVVCLQLAYWLKTGWIQYVVATFDNRSTSVSKLVQRAQMMVKRPPDFAEFADEMRAKGPRRPVI